MGSSMTITRRQFVAATATGLAIPTGVFALGSTKPIDNELTGKVICGYQGWFNARGDGMDFGFRHYDVAGKGFRPGHCSVDLWPDVDGYDKAARYDTPFLHKNGRVAQVFSSADKSTLTLHHQWMREYGIDGAALQRFGLSLDGGKLHRMRDRVLENTRTAAKQQGRLWMNMYDLSGMDGKQVQDRVVKDWQGLVDRGITNDPNYLHHQGKPVLSIWGVGFGGRRYNIHACNAVIDRINKEKRYAIMLGTPYHWREQIRDADRDPRLHDTLRRADILSPWAVGRLSTPGDTLNRLESQLKPDLAWCKDAGIHYLPVIFPGFSWYNLKKARGQEGRLDQIPRRKGAFLWAQAEAARKAGAESLYVAMLDEIDEGTAIFKCTNDPPVGESPFLDYEGLPSDHYLWLTGQIAARLRRGKAPAIREMPKRPS